MEKVTTKIIETEEHVHDFYCDECSKHIGTSREHTDGWYMQLGEFNQRFLFNDNWYSVKKCLCDECREKYIEKITNILLELGFVKG